jgi:hypothetical protein
MHILNPQWRQAGGISGAGMATNFVSPLLGWGLGRFPAPTAFFNTYKIICVVCNPIKQVNPGSELSPSSSDKRPQQRLDLCASHKPR